jgi:hypothetical protein
VVGAEVIGTWSGLITGGDARRDTDANGVATFYSARSKASGNVTFCVSGVTRTGSTYDPNGNAATCSTIAK